MDVLERVKPIYPWKTDGEKSKDKKFELCRSSHHHHHHHHHLSSSHVNISRVEIMSARSHSVETG